MSNENFTEKTHSCRSIAWSLKTGRASQVWRLQTRLARPSGGAASAPRRYAPGVAPRRNEQPSVRHLELHSDYPDDPRSSIIDGLSTLVIGGKLVKILASYDNEWGFSNRLVDLALMMEQRGL